MAAGVELLMDGNRDVEIFVKNSSEQERGIFPSLPDTSTFGVNSSQMAQIRAQKTQNDPNSGGGGAQWGTQIFAPQRV
mgnify:CR=1 FL=1